MKTRNHATTTPSAILSNSQDDQYGAPTTEFGRAPGEELRIMGVYSSRPRSS